MNSSELRSMHIESLKYESFARLKHVLECTYCVDNTIFAHNIEYIFIDITNSQIYHRKHTCATCSSKQMIVKLIWFIDYSFISIPTKYYPTFHALNID